MRASLGGRAGGLWARKPEHLQAGGAPHAAGGVGEGTHGCVALGGSETLPFRPPGEWVVLLESGALRVPAHLGAGRCSQEGTQPGPTPQTD